MYANAFNLNQSNNLSFGEEFKPKKESLKYLSGPKLNWLTLYHTIPTSNFFFSHNFIIEKLHHLNHNWIVALKCFHFWLR